MKLIPQRKRINVVSLDDGEGNAPKRQRHGSLLPDSIRALYVGPSNCGKTNAMLTLLLHENGLRFRNVYLYTKTPFQPKYQMLGEILRGIPGMGFFVFSDTEEIIPPSKAEPYSVFIFDDIGCDKQRIIKEYFSMGRHFKVDCILCYQSYTDAAKQLLRDNANFIALWRQDENNLKHLYDDHVNTDMLYSQLKAMCALCWNDHKHGFMTIVKDSPLEDGRYRRGYDTYIKK